MATEPKRKKPAGKGGILRDQRFYVGMGGLFLIVAIPLLVMLVLGVFDEFLPARVSAESYEQLQVGMKAGTARRILGQVSRIDKSAVPRLTGHAAQYQKPDHTYPLRLIWEDDEDVIWVDIHRGKVVKFGATLDGQRFGADPDIRQLGRPETPKEPEKKEPDPEPVPEDRDPTPAPED